MKNIKQALMRLIGVSTLALLLSGCGAFQPTQAPRTEGPNFLIIISDDQRYDTMEFMPQTTSLIFDRSVTFNSAYVTTSRCCPSRAAILTGMYNHNNGVYTNESKLRKPTFVKQMYDAGYFTGIVGKYLNSYPTKPKDRPLREFNVWNVFASEAIQYKNPTMNINGHVKQLNGYQTDIIRDQAIEFFRKADQSGRPFMLIFAPRAPHLPAPPAKEDENLYSDLPLYRPPSFNPQELTGKPEWLASRPVLTEKQIAAVDNQRLNQLRSLQSLDRAVASLIEELKAEGKLDNTVVIYISDNGLFWGDYRLLTGKIYVYEQSTHVPFAISYPLLTEPAAASDLLVANIDIAPTVLELAGLPIPDTMDGRSLVPILKGESNTEWRDHLLLEGWPINAAPIGNSPFFQAIHTDRYVYVETEGDKSELYDLETDPYELHNLIDDSGYADVLALLQGKLTEERKSIPPVPNSVKNAAKDQGD